MTEMYVTLVLAGRRTCNAENNHTPQVPKTYLQAVLERLTDLGCDADGHPI